MTEDCRRFHHLVGYGATYYSYLYAQALSSAIWQQHFANGQISRSSGECYTFVQAHESRQSQGQLSEVYSLGAYTNALFHHAGDHIRRTMLQCGSAKDPVQYVHGMLGDGHLVPVNGGFKPQISSLLKDLQMS